MSEFSSAQSERLCNLAIKIAAKQAASPKEVIMRQIDLHSTNIKLMEEHLRIVSGEKRTKDGTPWEEFVRRATNTIENLYRQMQELQKLQPASAKPAR